MVIVYSIITLLLSKPSVRVSVVNRRNLVNVKYVLVKIPECVMLFSVSTLLTP